MLTGLDPPLLVLLLCCGVLVDLLLGEARRWHPLVGFGRIASLIEATFNRGSMRTLRGIGGWCAAVIPFAVIGWLLCGALGAIVHIALLYFSLGLRSLREHNLPIAAALAKDDLSEARRLTARIVSRDTKAASAAELAKASSESLLENGNDAVFGTLFWFVVAGGPGALFFRLANTLDAMWGYRNERFQRYGWAAARIDDVLNYVPARLTALSYLLLAVNRRAAWHCWRTQSPAWSSPNAGPVMATGAAALGVSLGVSAIYDGVAEDRPPLGYGRAAEAADIARAWRLVALTTALWLLAAIGAGAIWFLWKAWHA